MKTRKFFAMALALVMVISAMAVPAFAAESAADVAPSVTVEPAAPDAAGVNDGVMPLSYTTSTTVRTNGAYTLVAQESGGFGCNVTISLGLFDATNYKVDVGLYNSLVTTSPTTQFSDFFGISNSPKTIFVPSNIKCIQVRISPRSAIAVGASSYTCTVTVNK